MGLLLTIILTCIMYDRILMLVYNKLDQIRELGCMMFNYVRSKIVNLGESLIKNGTNYVLIYLLIVTSLLALKTVNSEEIAVPMPYVCNKPVQLQHLTPEACVRSCGVEGLSSNTRNITIYQQYSEVPIPLLECELVKVSKRFTKTWTFSKIEEDLPDQYLSPNIQRCWDSLHEICQGKPCETHRPNIPDQYYYASDYIGTSDWVKLKYRDTRLPLSIGGKAVIEIEGIHVDYETGSSLSRVNPNKIYLWKVDKDIKCSVLPAYTMQCNTFEKAGIVTHFLCGRGRIMITVGSPLEEKLCNQDNSLEVSQEGLIFGRKNSPVYIPDGLPIHHDSISSAIKDVTLQNRVSLLLQEEHVCRTSCFNFRIGEHPEVKLYGRLVVSTKDGISLSCSEDLTCQIQHPVRVCQSKNLIEITCSGSKYWWDSQELVARIGVECLNTDVKTSNQISFAASSGIYRVNTTGLYYIAGQEIKPQFKIPNLQQEIIWLNKEKVMRAVSEAVQSIEYKGEIKSEIKGFTFPDLGILSWLGNVQHEIKVWVILGSCFVLTFLLLVRMINKTSYVYSTVEKY